ncbi:MAG: hypothetical protein WBF21_05135 [Steroidobacteraceae bacterium]|jgi:hypothetical protein
MHTKLLLMGVISAAFVLTGCAMPSARTSAATARNSSCLTSTGTRVQVAGSDCSAIGRAYSSEDIDRTGATTTADALRLMDPSVTIHH